MLSESFISAIAFVLFVGFTYRPIKNVILSALDEKIAETIKQMDEASALRVDAEKLFSDATAQLVEAQYTAKEMISNAQAKAKEILEDVEQEVSELAAKKTASSLQRIALQEKKVIDEIKIEAVELAMSYVEQALIDELDKNAQLTLIENNIGGIKKVIH